MYPPTFPPAPSFMSLELGLVSGDMWVSRTILAQMRTVESHYGDMVCT